MKILARKVTFYRGDKAIKTVSLPVTQEIGLYKPNIIWKLLELKKKFPNFHFKAIMEELVKQWFSEELNITVVEVEKEFSPDPLTSPDIVLCSE